MSLTIYILNICSIPILVHFTRPCFPPVFELSRGRLVGDGLLFLSCLRGWCQWIQGTLYRKPAFLLQISLQPSLILGKWGSCKEKMAEFQQRRFSQCEIGKFQYVSVRLGNLQLTCRCFRGMHKAFRSIRKEWSSLKLTVLPAREKGYAERTSTTLLAHFAGTQKMQSFATIWTYLNNILCIPYVNTQQLPLAPPILTLHGELCERTAEFAPNLLGVSGVLRRVAWPLNRAAPPWKNMVKTVTLQMIIWWLSTSGIPWLHGCHMLPPIDCPKT